MIAGGADAAAPTRSRRAVGLAVGAGALVAVGALAWALLSGREPPPRPTPTAALSPVASTPADRLAGRSTLERVRVAERAAFPNGRSYASPDGPHIAYEPGTLVDVPFGPVLVNEGRVPDGSHADSGHVAIHYLVPEGRGYRVIGAYPDAVRSGSFGELGELAVSRKFGRLPVVYTQGGGTWQGYTCSWTTLTELGPKGPRELATFMDAYDDSGATVDGAGGTTRGKITDIVPDRSFAVTFTGTRSFTARYVRQGDSYVLEGGERNALTGC